ncbi:MAG TPA: amidase [Steroidobacteraceae bacterium]|nr:amidase [Steroidobacteraceae bacterium]
MKTLEILAAELSTGATSSRQLVEDCLERIADHRGEGARTFQKVHAEAARAAADYHDQLRRIGAAASAWAGIPVSIKDLFDISGDVTTAGSKVLREAAPARRDAPVVARLRSAGFVPIGRTTMTEFAFSGLGLNPHYGTPRNPFDRARGRIPGGSSSGAAVSVTDQMAYGAIGTDTGGSCRIPAAFCGIVGFKPTAARVPLAGTFPLSTTLDSVGPLAASVACCATLDAILAAEADTAQDGMPVRGLRLAVPACYVMDDLDPHVARSFQRTMTRLAQAGADIREIPLAELEELPHINRKGGFAAAEAYAVHRARLARSLSDYDPRVSARILRGREQDAADYLELQDARRNLKERVDRLLADFDVVAMPTTPIIAPTFDDVAADADYGRLNLLALRNPTVTNILDRCAISLPCHEAGSAPVGLMLMGHRYQDRRLLRIAATVEALVAPRGGEGRSGRIP